MVVVEILMPRLDGRSTITNCLIWVGFANEADADSHDGDSDTMLSVEDLSAHAQEELYRGGTSDKTTSSSQVLLCFLSVNNLLQQLVAGHEKHSVQYNRPQTTFKGAKHEATFSPVL